MRLGQDDHVIQGIPGGRCREIVRARSSSAVLHECRRPRDRRKSWREGQERFDQTRHSRQLMCRRPPSRRLYSRRERAWPSRSPRPFGAELRP